MTNSRMTPMASKGLSSGFVKIAASLYASRAQDATA